MRRVKVWKYEKGVMLFDGEATFHRWGCDYEEFENGPGNFTTAVIERDDGTVETPPANWIAFLSNTKHAVA